MSQLVQINARGSLPAIIAAAGEHAEIRFLEFFAASILNAHTRRAYAGAVGEFLSWCEGWADQVSLPIWDNVSCGLMM